MPSSSKIQRFISPFSKLFFFYIFANSLFNIIGHVLIFPMEGMLLEYLKTDEITCTLTKSYINMISYLLSNTNFFLITCINFNPEKE